MTLIPPWTHLPCENCGMEGQATRGEPKHSPYVCSTCVQAERAEARMERLQADLTEAQAEIAAFQGQPVGGLPGWVFESPRWVKVIKGSVRPVNGRVSCERLSVDIRTGTVSHSVSQDGGQTVTTLRGSAGHPTPRSGMRFADDWQGRTG